MRAKLIIAFAAILAVLFCSTAYATANSWAQVYSDEELHVSADLTSLQDKGATFVIDEKYEYITDWTRNIISLGKKEKIYSCVQKTEYKKDECAYKIISFAYYNQDGVLFLKEEITDSVWHYAAPWSSAEKCWEAHMRFIRFKQQQKQY